MLELDELIDGMLAAIKRNIPSVHVSLDDIGPDADDLPAGALLDHGAVGDFVGAVGLRVAVEQERGGLTDGHPRLHPAAP